MTDSGTKSWATSKPGTTSPITPTSDELALVRDFNGKEYTATLVSKGGYPAAEYCAGLTYGNKEWFLPSGGQWYLINNVHQTIYDAIAKIKYQDAEMLICSSSDGASKYYYPRWSSNITLYNSSSTNYEYAFCSELTSFDIDIDTVTSSMSYSSNSSVYDYTYYKARCIAEY